MSSMKRLLALTALALGVWCIAEPAQAQFYNPYRAYYQAAFAQQAWNAQMMQGMYGNPMYTQPLTPTVNPYTGQPTQLPVNSGVPPYSGIPADYSYGGNGYGYNPYNPYYSNSLGMRDGYTLMGAADVMRSYGQNLQSQEQARLLREQWQQARIETRKKQFDLEMYIRANTPTYTQEQERITKVTLRRIQTNSLPGEITNGKSINFLLDDLRKYPGKKPTGDPVLLSEGVLQHLNVTKGNYGLGVLRDGKVNWPTTIADLMNANQQKALTTQLQDLVKQGFRGERIDTNVLKDVRNEIDKLREDLVKRVNDVPTGQYLDAKRFLQELSESTLALERGEAQIQANYLRFIENGKSVQDVVDYLVQNGLKVGPATAADEAAYRAVHSALANYDVAMNAQHAKEAQPD